MKAEKFLDLAELLTGTDLKAKDTIDLGSLGSILADDERPIDCSQFNELLLLVHKNRVEATFFEYFFGMDCTVGKLSDGVQKFRKTAMLRYGNFVYGFRTLSRSKSMDSLQAELCETARDPKEEEESYRARKPRLLDIGKIERNLTPYVGYLSAGEARADFARCELLSKTMEGLGIDANWDGYVNEVKKFANVEAHRELQEIIEIFRQNRPGSSLAEFCKFLKISLTALSDLDAKIKEVRRRAERNQDTYLTWDHMDVYFATSMRKAWEYEDLFDFIDGLMSRPELNDLNIHHFDPTQCFTANRVNKGLVEALMLKRARCTVYSVQDTDTLGKDSELASTLAQGKPVIAYIPEIEVENRAQELAREDPGVVFERLRFVLYADDQLPQRLNSEENNLVDRGHDQLKEFLSQRIWPSLPDDRSFHELQDVTPTDQERLCGIIAAAERAIYDRRAKTLRESHPLAIQVNLGTGVANGVLVVRRVEHCAALLRRILLNDMEFEIEIEGGMWYLREKISGCIYRVVTNDRKLNNCFWNFYLR
jgi:hypothetical protein